MKNIIVLHTTVANIEDARKMADVLLNLKLIACAQIDGPIESVYNWEGSMETEKEYRLTVKTIDDLADQLIEKMKALHPYDIAEIIGQPFLYCSDDYKNWVANEVNNV